MVCSNCGQSGHNKRTCPSLTGKMEKKKVTKGVNVKKVSPIKKGTKCFEDLKTVTSQQAEEKLTEIRNTRPEQYKMAEDCIKSLTTELDDGTVGKNCSIKAEEKTGKRVIMEAIHLITIINHGCSVLASKTPPRSVYVTALNRKDTKDQFREQEDEFGILSIVATRTGDLVGEIIKLLKDNSHDGVIYIHLDECDYGTGREQSLSKLWFAEELNLPKHKNRIKYVTYSATPEELEFSSTMENGLWDCHIFKPSENYKGAEWYLDNELVFKPEVFFDGKSDFTEQGVELIKQVNDKCTSPENPVEERMRNVIVVRDTGKNHLNLIREVKENLETKYSCEIHIFDQSNGFYWGEKEAWGGLGMTEKLDENLLHKGYSFKTTVIFISGICTRSTELCPLGHKKIAIWHDSRMLDDKKAYNTISQAIGRVKHYTQPGQKPNLIKLYCDENVLKMTIGINDDTKNVIVGQRVHTMKSKQSNVRFIGYDDGYGEIDGISSDNEDWQDGDPNSGYCHGAKGIPIPNATFNKVNEKWCKGTKQAQMWNSKEHGGCGGNAGRQGVLQYERPNSDRWMYRIALYGRKQCDNIVNEISFETKQTSMYS